MSTVKANKIQLLDGTTYNVPIQVVYSVIHDDAGTTSADQTASTNFPATVVSTTTTTWTDYTPLQLTITPKYANSLIKLELYWYMYAPSAQNGAIRIRRGTQLVWRPMMNTTGPFSMGHLGSSDHHGTYALSCIDIPNTTAPITYMLQYRTYSGGNCRFFGWAEGSHWAPKCTFIATEIAR